MLKRPPHILVTTPESLYILLTAEKSRAILRDVETVIVDEIHAVADDKRGAHLALSLERLEALTASPAGAHRAFRDAEADRRGRALSDRQRPARLRSIVNVGHKRKLDLARRSSRQPNSAPSPPTKCGTRSTTASWNWSSSIARRWSSSTRGGWRSGWRITWASGWAKTTSPRTTAACRASCASRRRRKLKEGEIKVLVATASLELGIDIGTVDLVCQISSPRAIAVALQRVGRSGHWRGAIPKGRFFATTRDELAGMRGAGARHSPGRTGPADHSRMLRSICWRSRSWRCALRAAADSTSPRPTMTTAGMKTNCSRWSRAPIPIAISRARLTTQFSTCSPKASPRSRGRYGAYLHRDRVNRKLRARRGAGWRPSPAAARFPTTALFTVVAEPEGIVVGTAG